MRTAQPEQFDFVIAGCGVAGLRAAIELGGASRVLVLAKSGLGDPTTAAGQGGIAASLSDEDQVCLHAKDTLEAGDGLADPAAVQALVEEAPACIEQLIEWGMQFERSGTKLAFTREGAHSRSRVLHAQGVATGREITHALFAKAHAAEKIEFREHAFSVELLTQDGRVGGLRYLDETRGAFHEIHAGAVLLATGGLGQAFRETTNPELATGDGTAMAYEVGATLSDLEFVQFYPATLAVKGAPRTVLPVTLGREGGVLRNVDLERFMKRYHEAAELAPREVLARAILTEMQRTETDYVYLDMTALNADTARKRYPRIFDTVQNYGLDITRDLLPVRPAAHFSIGGVRTDLWGRTGITGLYAAGETAATWVHGANRLPSNSLLEGLVFGARAGRAMREDAPSPPRAAATAVASGESGNVRHAKNTNGAGTISCKSAALEHIRTILWKDAGIIRSGRQLSLAIEQLGALTVERPERPTRAACELHNLWTLAQLIARAALAREESRGCHYRSDFPYQDEKLQKHSLLTCGKKICFA